MNQRNPNVPLGTPQVTHTSHDSSFLHCHVLEFGNVSGFLFFPLCVNEPSMFSAAAKGLHEMQFLNIMICEWK